MTRNDRHLTIEDLTQRIDAGEIDTVVVAFTDMQGRLQGKRLHGRYFVDHALEHGVEGCNYLLAVDIDMNTVAGYAMSSWEKGYGDMEFVPDWSTLRLLTHMPATAMVEEAMTRGEMRSHTGPQSGSEGIIDEVAAGLVGVACGPGR